MALRVTQPFADHEVGDEITDAAAIKAILASEQGAFVVRVEDAPPPAPTSASPATQE